jgi:TAP-like protein
VLLTWDGDGHTAYNRGSTCINRAVEAYLVQGTPPADGTTC